jgi:hypothetical protein
MLLPMAPAPPHNAILKIFLRCRTLIEVYSLTEIQAVGGAIERLTPSNSAAPAMTRRVLFGNGEKPAMQLYEICGDG